MKLLCSILVLGIISASPARADDCAPKTDHRSDKSGGIVIRDFVIGGTRALDSAELSRISGTFIGSCFDDDKEDIEERVRAEFQNRGFFTVEVKGMSIKPVDPLGHPKAVAVDVEIAEGALYRLSKISFVDNRAVSSKELQAAFPLHSGDRFARERVAMGLESMRRLYLTSGHIDMVAIPNTLPDSNGTVALEVQVIEGPQYRMGKFTVKGKKELADALQAGWRLEEGAIFDRTYVEKYLSENKSLLGEDFKQSNGIQVIRNCRENSVDVRLLLPDSPESFSPAPTDIDCDKPEPEKTN